MNAIWKGRAVSDAALTTRLNTARTFQIMHPFLRMSISENVVVGANVRAKTDAEARHEKFPVSS